MKKLFIVLIVSLTSLSFSFSQESLTEQEVINISKEKWQWMADKDVDKLANLFHDKSKFVHMSGTWNKDRSLKSLKPEVSGIKKPMYTM